MLGVPADELGRVHPSPALAEKHDRPAGRVRVEEREEVRVVRVNRDVARVVAAAQAAAALIPEDDAVAILEAAAVDRLPQADHFAVVVPRAAVEHDDDRRRRIAKRLGME
jgi:hypothetical protein